MRNRMISCVGIMMLSLAFARGSVALEETRSQHDQWMKKLETPGGTLHGSLNEQSDMDALPAFLTLESLSQHRQWIQKLETPGGTFRSAF